MPPPVPNKMAVASVCLDDMTADNGQLIYYPGSHKVEPYRFSHGGLHAIPSEMDDCMEHVRNEIAARGVREERFFGKRGDVFIWHAQLFHGGAPILRKELKRRSLVTHFWRANDCASDQVSSTSRGYILAREHHQAA
jgi:phytanoyl-CoA hydroxylase